MLKRKVSCTFKRKITLEIQERIYPLENCRRDGGATVANRHYILQTLVRTAGRKGLRYRRTGNHGRKETGAGVATRRLNTTP
jgi:hypothetical protein